MSPVLHPDGRPMLIGSQPLTDHDRATELVLTHVPEIPNWVQLPVYKQEGMVAQFAPGMPGVVLNGDRIYVDTAQPDFDARMVAFFEAYLAVVEQPDQLAQSPFALNPSLAKGFFSLIAALEARLPADLYAVKGQITGPFTFCTGLTDQDRRAIFYDDTLRDAAVKMMAVKAAWQVQQLARFGKPVILFIDEPALAGYGSSEFISISRQDIVQCLAEVIQAVHDQGGAAGVHVCANTDWSLLLDAGVDIVNFDAHGYFDKLMLYGKQLAAFINDGGCLAWGMVPTATADQVAAATLDGLWSDWQTKVAQLAAGGIDPQTARRQAFITPSCGTGSLPPDASAKVLALTQALSRKIRAA
ncbi:MAG: hypothetical protein KFF50_05215 [Desulfatitalea sp.]|nr:hypothetical protein [Desulfatitalea sp.]